MQSLVPKLSNNIVYILKSHSANTVSVSAATECL